MSLSVDQDAANTVVFHMRRLLVASGLEFAIRAIALRQVSLNEMQEKMMFAVTRRTQDARTMSGQEEPWSEEGATETWNDAQVFDNSMSLSRQFWSRSKIAEERIRSWPRFFMLWQVIGIISAYDAFLAMKYRDELPYIESNFIGQLLLLVNGDDPAVFLGVKFLGTIMVLGILANLYHTRPRWAMSVAYGVAGFQVGLWAYLNWA